MNLKKDKISLFDYGQPSWRVSYRVTGGTRVPRAAVDLQESGTKVIRYD